MTSLFWVLYLYWIAMWWETSKAQESIGLPDLKPASLYVIPGLTASWVHRGYHCWYAMFTSGNLCHHLPSYHHYPPNSLKSFSLDKIHINNFLKLIMMFINIITFYRFIYSFIYLVGKEKKYLVWAANSTEHYIR